MNIGFDLDKVFIDHPPFVPDWLIHKLYGEKANGHLSYRVPGKFEQFIRQLSHMPLLRPLIRENLSTLEHMKNRKNLHLFLISSRFGFLQKKTNTLIKKYHLEKFFVKLVFNYENQQPHVFKEEMLSKNHIDRFVDDDLPLLKYLAKKNSHIAYFWLNNEKNEQLSSSITAIKHLSSVFEKI